MKSFFPLNRSVKKEQQRIRSMEQDQSSFTPEITKTAHNLKRQGSVEQILIKKNDEYKAHKEELRRQKESEEVRAGGIYMRNIYINDQSILSPKFLVKFQYKKKFNPSKKKNS